VNSVTSQRSNSKYPHNSRGTSKQQTPVSGRAEPKDSPRSTSPARAYEARKGGRNSIDPEDCFIIFGGMQPGAPRIGIGGSRAVAHKENVAFSDGHTLRGFMPLQDPRA
jgi:hypothetical protein